MPPSRERLLSALIARPSSDRSQLSYSVNFDWRLRVRPDLIAQTLYATRHHGTRSLTGFGTTNSTNPFLGVYVASFSETEGSEDVRTV